jgi:hypothetical protein
VRDDERAAETVVEPHEPVDDDHATDREELAGLAYAPISLTIATEPPQTSAFPVLSPPGACRYLQLDGVRQASCLALSPTIALAPRQVELVCLGAAHADCPRLARAGSGEDLLAVAPSELAGRSRDAGAVGTAPAVEDVPRAPSDEATAAGTAGDMTATMAGAEARTGPWPQAAVPSVRLGQTVGSLRVRPQARRSFRLRPATMVATGTLVAAIVFAIGFAAMRGGLDLSVGGAPAGPIVAASLPGTATPAGPSSGADASGGVAAATASRSAGEASAPAPQSSGLPSPAVSPDRLALLTPCPDQPDCYQYRVRRHDNLHGIASFFGVPYQTVLDLNPQIENPSLIHVGQIIILPPPGP